MQPYKNTYKTLGTLVVIILIGAGGVWYYENKVAVVPSVVPTQQTRAVITASYAKLYQPAQPTAFSAGLQQLRDIAADDQSTPVARMQALNGINFAYTQSTFDADTIYNIVFSSPPFAQLYDSSLETTVDILHPEAGGKVPAVEAALVKLNEISNSLIPNHYAISRMEVAQIFAFERATATTSAAETATLRTQYADQIQSLVAAYNALPALQSSPQYTYSTPMEVQILYAQGSTMAFLGRTYKQKNGDFKQGEALFQQALQIETNYPTTAVDYGSVLDESLLARIFYAVYYWTRYDTAGNDKYIEDVIRPLTDVQTVQNTAVYKSYLPTHKTAQVEPFTTLRAIAAKMPELKTFLQGEGWTF